MSSTALALTIVSLLFAVWMSLLTRRSAAGRLGRNGPGIRLQATTKCEHTWDAAQRAAAPLYRRVAISLALCAVLIAALGIAGASSVALVVVWLVVAIGSQMYFLGTASLRATQAAKAVRCEHQPPPKPASAHRPRPRGKRRR